MNELTWSCHVCGDIRPDDRISVQSNKVMIGAVEAQENIRYCNDKPTCIEGSKEVTFLGKVGKRD